MREVAIGIITAPGVPEKLIKDIIGRLEGRLAKLIDEEAAWHVEYEINPLASSAEFISDTFTKVESIRNNNNWNMAIAVSDLPSVSNKKIVISEFDHHEKNSLISVAALGIFRNKKNLENLLLHHIEVLHDKGGSVNTDEIQHPFISRITEVTPSGDSVSKRRFVLKSTIGGWMRLVSGMTYLNEPWTEFTNFKTIIALAFATGTYISIFQTPWELSLDYSLWRYVLLMIIAIFGMVIWLVYAHNLWEPSSTKNQPVYRRLYNFTTLLTLLIITLTSYLAVCLLLTVSIMTFVPMELFETWTETDPDVKWVDYLNLIWFTASLGLLAGAFGSTAEEEEKIRNVTYSYRQMYRYRQLQKEEEEASEADKDEEHEGEEQTHDETEEEK